MTATAYGLVVIVLALVAVLPRVSRSSADHNSVDRSSVDRSSVDRSSVDRSSVDRSSVAAALCECDATD
jgi:hypothetical protein